MPSSSPSYETRAKAPRRQSPRHPSVRGLTRRAAGSWCVDVQESGSAEVKRGVFVSNEEEVEVPGGRGTAHLVLRFQKGGKACSISVREVKGQTRPLTAEDTAPVALVAFECRGCALVGWTPTSGYRCRSTGGTAFEDVDLTEGEWADYDEENDLSVMIENVESSFETIKE